MRQISAGQQQSSLPVSCFRSGAGWLIHHSLAGAAHMLLWAGLARIFLFRHFASFAVNSLCHSFGRRRYTAPDHSTNLAWLARPASAKLDHNHHAFPRSARHGLRWWEIDPWGYVISLLTRAGIAHNVIQITDVRERQRRRLRVSHDR